MQVFAGTYQGNVVFVGGQPTELRTKMSRQYSENSLRSMAVTGRDILVGGYDQQFRSIDSHSGTQTKESKDSKGIINVIRSINSGLLVLGLDNGTIRFWDKTSWSPRRDVKQHKKSISDIRIDSKGVMMISVGGRQMIFWNIASMNSLYHYRYDYDIDQVLLLDTFESLFQICGRTIRQLSTEDNKQLHTIEVNDKVQCGLIFLNFLIVATQKGQIKIWQHGHYEHCIHFKAHEGRVKDMKEAHYEGADYLLTADSNGVISCWDILQFIKGVDQISQDYHLEGLQPLSSAKTNQRVICIEVARKDEDQVEEENQKQTQKEEQQVEEKQQQEEVRVVVKEKKKKFQNKKKQINKEHPPIKKHK